MTFRQNNGWFHSPLSTEFTNMASEWRRRGFRAGGMWS